MTTTTTRSSRTPSTTTRDSATHRAIIRAPTKCVFVEVPTPQPGPGEILLAPEAVAVCGTDIQILRRMRPDPADVVGHEGFARVVAVGSGVTGTAAGDRVMVNPTAPGNPNFLLGHNVPGLLQERVVVNAAAVAGGQLLPVPDQLPAALGTLTEPLAVVTYALECLRNTAPRHLVVDGGGLIGLLAATRARRVLGADTAITVLHRHDAVRRWAVDRIPGIHRTWSLDDDPMGLADVSDGAALLSAVYRDATTQHVERLLEVLGNRLIAVHVIGGVQDSAHLRDSNSVDLAAVRADNTGGPWPPHASSAGSQLFTGNRGVSNARLALAAGDLAAHGHEQASLLTHVVGPEDGVRLLNRIVAGDRHDSSGEPIIRLVIRFG
ncbi:alcohol dehydrogenase catalytic domain-containing protein [Xylanimonas protaetiae]|uniref:Alcohol dehydrogenase n=1 Tax=Xylanimonas protaetiae TaxID=2509457 RepID=A0A4P6EZY8_9MICO|nr:alcohol dehydrogenase catalytic domain-containing protein [Xylanimonas protaetiae]QAY68752.1 alcohol dehydrogenase [Xylanimonas protaetiae]